MCEGVSKDSWYGTGHVDIQVQVCIILLEYVWLPLHEHLVGKFNYWALLTLSWE